MVLEGPVAQLDTEIQAHASGSRSSMTPQEEVAYARMKAFCSNIIKQLAPPLIKEV